MRRLFVYTPLVHLRLKEFDDADLKACQIENEILNNRNLGDVVPGTGGVRKFRITDETRGKGKRGGLRVFYLDLPHVEKAYVLFILRKGEAEDLTTDEKKTIREIVSVIKKECKP